MKKTLRILQLLIILLFFQCYCGCTSNTSTFFQLQHGFAARDSDPGLGLGFTR